MADDDASPEPEIAFRNYLRAKRRNAGLLIQAAIAKGTAPIQSSNA
jgi:hypothetical protein